jgi:hypothetical protein
LERSAAASRARFFQQALRWAAGFRAGWIAAGYRARIQALELLAPVGAWRRVGRWSLAAALLAATGCRFHAPIGPDNCAAITPGAIPPLTGTYVCQWQHAQMDRAEAGKYVINKCEWFSGGTTLGPEGSQHVLKIAKTVAETGYPVVVSRSDDEALNETRRQWIVGQLLVAGLADADQRVIVERPEAEGLYGPEATRYGSMRQLGINGMMGGMGGGGFGGGGLGGGGFGGGGLGGGGGIGGGMMGGGGFY